MQSIPSASPIHWPQLRVDVDPKLAPARTRQTIIDFSCQTTHASMEYMYAVVVLSGSAQVMIAKHRLHLEFCGC